MNVETSDYLKMAMSSQTSSKIGHSSLGRLSGLNVWTDFVPVDNAQPSALTKEQIEAWNRDGFIAGLPVLDGAELDVARQRLISLEGQLAPRGLPLNLHAKYALGQELVCQNRTLSYLQDLIGQDIICFISEYINKRPGSPSTNHGHQDCVFNAIAPGCVIVWLAFEDADEGNGCMHFVPGSHHLGVLECDERHSVKDRTHLKGWVPAPVKAGHCVIMSDMLVHSSPENPSTTRYRPALTATYARADTALLEEFTSEPILCSGGHVHRNWNLRSIGV